MVVVMTVMIEDGGDIVLPEDLVPHSYCSADTRGKEGKEMITPVMMIINRSLVG